MDGAALEAAEAGWNCGTAAVGASGRRERHRERLRGARNLDVLPAEHPQELGLRLGAAVVGREGPGRRPLAPRLFDRAFGLGVEVRQQLFAVVGRESERDEEPRLLVVVVVALRPLDARPGRILAVPGARILLRSELAHLGVGAAIAESLVEAADAAVHRRQEHQVAGTPGVELAVGEDAGHSHPRHLADVRPAKELPLVGQQRVDPGVVGTGAHRIVVEEGDRFVQVVENLRVPAEMCVEDVAGERERHPHGVAVVVVRHVATPVGEARPGRIGVGEMPAVEVHHAVAAVDLDHRGDERDQIVADLADVGTLVDRQAVGELHERGGRARLGGVDGAGDVVDRDARGDERLRARVVELQGPRVGELGETRPVLVRPAEVLLRGDRHRDPFAALFTGADRDHAHSRARLGEKAEIAMHVGGVGQVARCSGDVAEHDLRRRDARRGRQVVGERRVEFGCGGVAPDALRGIGIDRLREVGHEARRQAGRDRAVECEGSGAESSGTEDPIGNRTTHREVSRARQKRCRRPKPIETHWGPSVSWREGSHQRSPARRLVAQGTRASQGARWEERGPRAPEKRRVPCAARRRASQPLQNPSLREPTV